MTSEIKNTAIVAAGYVYQTLQGVNLLCDWLDAPTRYVRVRFECDEDAVAPQGLDDLVAERPDGRVDLWQVKFTPAPEKHALDWEWLLTRSGKVGGKSRTNLRKWFDALDAVGISRAGEVQLLTNRVPDLTMESCLTGGLLIDYKLAPADIQTKVEQDIGGEANAQRLFDVLAVRHSDKGFSSIESYVTQRLRKHSTPEGIETLKNRAVHWSIERTQPGPNGWITFDILQATLRVIAPQPLPEDFVIPGGYRVPDNEFHIAFMALLKVAPKQPIVLTGPPGRGKSTYLSKVCQLLEKADVPFVRHHYYLSATDRSVDRYTSFAVHESLLAQVTEFHPKVAMHDRTLAPVIEACATHYKNLDKPFVVILDGLDHVWRTQGNDKRSLDEIFNQLLPVCDNLVLIVGTQPVDDVQLPVRLLAEAPRNTWKVLPAMSADAVLQYLRKEVKQGRLQVRIGNATAEADLQASAAKMRERTAGHPLHVIYATEELIRTGKELSVWSIDKLTGDLSQDAKTYYGSLWHLITASQKDILRLVCEFPFFWPKHAFAEIATLSGTPRPEVSAVEHLLHASSAGLRPFHESLIVFVKQTEDFQERTDDLSGFVETWLGSTAPTALRVNWLWSVKSKRGSPDELIAGLERDWVLERLQEGYPTHLFETLLEDAEEQAVQKIRYSDAYRLRHLKYRLLNSVSHQLIGENAARLKACTWTLAPDVNVIDEAFASRHETSEVDIAALGLALKARGNASAANDCAHDALRRHRGESRFGNHNRGSDAQDRILYLFRALSELGALDSTPAAEAIRLADLWLPFVRKFSEVSVDRDELRHLVDIAVAMANSERKQLVCDAVFRAAALAEVDLSAWTEFSLMSSGPLSGCLRALYGADATVWVKPLDYSWQEGGYIESQEALAALAHEWFLSSAHLELTAGANATSLKAPLFKNRVNVSEYLDQLDVIGRDFAKLWAAGQVVKFSQLYQAFDAVKFSGYGHDYQLGQGAADFRRSLHRVAVDVQLMSSHIVGGPLVELADLQVALDAVWFDAAEFRTQYVSGLPKVLSDDAAKAFIEIQLAEFDANVKEDTGIRMMAMLELCEMALRHELTALAEKLCRTTWELALGYAQRKDPALSEVANALEYLMPHAPVDARRLLGEVSPQVNKVTSFTDGKGTRHVTAQADDLLANLDRKALVEKCRQHAEQGDWSEAENSLRAFLRTATTESVFTSAVLRTGVQFEAINSLHTVAAGGNALAAAMLSEVEQHRGADVGRIDQPAPKNSGTEFTPFLGDVKSYPVTDLSRLLTELSHNYGVRGEVLCEWYRYWDEQGQGSQLIAVLEPVLLSEACRNDDMSELLDLAFTTKLKLEGKAKAFQYIVQAQLYSGGWHGSLEKLEKTHKRLSTVAKTYKKRCDEFFLKSAFNWLDKPKQKRVIPSDLMVYFLGLQGRIAEAVQFAEAMVRCVQEDTRTLRLSTPTWAQVLPDVNVELELLMTRFRWPVASTRWWAMQELVLFLLSPATQADAHARLLQELRDARLEAETVEVLSIFWMAFKRGWVVTPELATEVKQVSLLAERLLADMGQQVARNQAPELRIAPTDFEIPISFTKLQAVGIPQIYATLMSHLEEKLSLPFMTQFAFEWSVTEAAYPEASYPGDLVYFVRPAGDRGTASFASREHLRMLTAFQRTLDVAVEFWAIPNTAAFQIARFALPLGLTTAHMRPSRPAWLPQLSPSLSMDKAFVTEFINEACRKLAEANPQAALLALVTPLFVSSVEIAEISVVRWRKWGAKPIDADALAKRYDSQSSKGTYGSFNSHGWETRSHLPSLNLAEAIDVETQSVPLAAIHTVERVGYLQKDLVLNRLYLPVVTKGQQVIVEPYEKDLKVSIDGENYATSMYWNAGWSPGHPREISGLHGTALVAEHQPKQTVGETQPEQYFLLWTLTILSRPSGYGAYDRAEPLNGVIMR